MQAPDAHFLHSLREDSQARCQCITALVSENAMMERRRDPHLRSRNEAGLGLKCWGMFGDVEADPVHVLKAWRPALR
jgi:hypothetical protein